MSIPRTAGLPGGPKRQAWTAVSGLTYSGPSSSNTLGEDIAIHAKQLVWIWHVGDPFIGVYGDRMD
jgi:hypothetical protein